MYGVQTWHDETARWEKTGQLDQGPCWCTDCLLVELTGGITGE